MKCTHCSLPDAKDEYYCSNCVNKLLETKPTATSFSGLKYNNDLLLILYTFFIPRIIFFFINIYSKYSSSFPQSIYTIFNWIFPLLTIAAIIYAMSNSKNKSIMPVLIIFLIIELGVTLFYRLIF